MGQGIVVKHGSTAVRRYWTCYPPQGGPCRAAAQRQAPLTQSTGTLACSYLLLFNSCPLQLLFASPLRFIWRPSPVWLCTAPTVSPTPPRPTCVPGSSACPTQLQKGSIPLGITYTNRLYCEYVSAAQHQNGDGCWFSGSAKDVRLQLVCDRTCAASLQRAGCLHTPAYRYRSGC